MSTWDIAHSRIVEKFPFLKDKSREWVFSNEYSCASVLQYWLFSSSSYISQPVMQIDYRTLEVVKEGWA